MKILQLRLLIVATFCLWHITGAAQNSSPSLPEVIPASPEAAALAKYINYPVDHSRGLVQINIPLLEITDGDITLPISLSYHASGLKVREVNGWIGAGWTLNAEPMVSRSIHGLPDEQSYYWNNQISNTPNISYLIGLVSESWDEEPDDFYYKLTDKSGGFIFKKTIGTNNAVPIAHPYEPVKIDYNISGSGNLAQFGFTVTDEKGIRYSFGKSETTIIDRHKLQTTCWKANSISGGPLNGSITFEYHPKVVASLTSVSDYTQVIDDCLLPFATNSSTNYLWLPPGSPFVTEHVHWQTIKEYYYDINQNQLVLFQQPSITYRSPSCEIEQFNIKGIYFTEGCVKFTKDNNGLLKEIQLFDNSNSLKKRIIFYQTNFNVNTDKIKLDSIRIDDQTYRFTYYDPLSVPNSADGGMDHWGYYNGDYGSLVPYQGISATYTEPGYFYTKVNFTIGGNNRNPYLDRTKAGILTSIKYPVGGVTEFEYEPNKYLEPAGSTIKIAGGLRISKITDTDPVSGKSMVRGFKYGTYECGWGYPKNPIELSNYILDQALYILLPLPSVLDIGRIRTYYSNYMLDLFYAQGASVLYDQVTEVIEGTGKTVYDYHTSSTPVVPPGSVNIYSV